VVLLFEELYNSGVELLAGVFIAQLDAERVQFIRFLLVAPVLLQLRLSATILPANIAKHSHNYRNPSTPGTIFRIFLDSTTLPSSSFPFLSSAPSYTLPPLHLSPSLRCRPSYS